VDEIPLTRCVRVGDEDVAYQVVGDTALDRLYFYGLRSRPASGCRLILFDRRGTGGSDDVPRWDVAVWEAWGEDVKAVLDASGSARAAIFCA
jgi:pimeloyl-ACP methyl ester carboxylesterase